MVLIAYLVAELYLSSKGWLVALPDGRELAHVRMRDLLLVVATPAMAVLGFAVGWFSHVDPGPGSTVGKIGPGSISAEAGPGSNPGPGGDSGPASR